MSIERPEGGWNYQGVSTHPGAVLREDYLVPLGMSAATLAGETGVPLSQVESVLREESPITPEVAVRLAKFFSGRAGFWLDMQSEHDLTKIEVERGASIAAEIRPMELTRAA